MALILIVVMVVLVIGLLGYEMVIAPVMPDNYINEPTEEGLSNKDKKDKNKI